MFKDRKIKTAFGMPLLDKMEFKTLGDSTVSIRFKYEYEDGGFYWQNALRINAFVEVVDKDDWQMLSVTKMVHIPQEAKCPAEPIKTAQTDCIIELMNKILYSGVK